MSSVAATNPGARKSRTIDQGHNRACGHVFKSDHQITDPGVIDLKRYIEIIDQSTRAHRHRVADPRRCIVRDRCCG